MNERPNSIQEWTASGDPTAVSEEIRERLIALGGTITGDSADIDSLGASFGSKLAFRMLGALIPGGPARIPLSVHVDVRSGAAADESVVRVELRAEDTGYLFRLNMVDSMIGQRFTEIVSGLKAADA